LPIHVLDDEVIIAEFVAEILSEHSNEILCFHSAEEYLLHAESEHYIEPELIISDVQMGGMDGLELISTLQEKGLKAKVIMMSGYNKYIDEPVHGIDGMLEKPFDPDKLLAVVSLLLNRNESRAA